MTEVFDFTLILAAFWFPIYWIIGSVVFATITIIQVVKLRKARFSCLFTILSAATAFAAAYAGLYYGQSQISVCLADAPDFFGALASVFACGVYSVFAAAGIGFVALILLGFIIYYISRAKNQSWVDTDSMLYEEDEVTFDNV